MSKQNCVLGDLIYANSDAGVRVFKGYLEPLHVPVALKELTFTTIRSCNQAVREAINHSSLTHPNIVQIYDCFLEGLPGGLFTANIVTELMDRDLSQEIEVRRDSDSFWTEAELLHSMRELISALSFAQSHGISHRDIKPQNIFTTRSSLKVGDFGASTRDFSSSASRRKSLQGSPFFLSPELKRAYISSMAGGDVNLDYDPVKSDVYSLGLTLLFMARLAPPGELMNLQKLGQVTKEVIGGLEKYPELQPWLGLMLEEDPENRPSFTDMEEQLASSESSSGEGDHSQGQPEDRRDTPPSILLSECSLLRAGIEGGQAACSQNASVARRVVRFKKREACIACGNQLGSELWISSLPPYISGYRVFAESCCSVQCLELYSGAFRASRCPLCLFSIPPSLSEVKPLFCGHTMHSQCWARAIAEKRNVFRPGVLNCPCCHVETRYVKEKGEAQVGKRFPRLKSLARKMKLMFRRGKEGGVVDS